MKLGAFLSCLSDRSLDEALDVVEACGLTSVEITAGGFLPPVHLPIEELTNSPDARQAYLGHLHDRGVELTALNANGNPLHPDPEVGPVHAEDIRRAVRLAGLLSVPRVVAMPGLPAGAAGETSLSWAVAPWDSALLDVQDYQWDQVGVPFWSEIDRLAADSGVQVCIEMHPHTLVFNTATLERLLDRTGATNLGLQMDPSHLFWQGIDPVTVIKHFGDRVFHAAAKDTRVNQANVALNGVLHDSFTRVPNDRPPFSIGGRYHVTDYPTDESWRFVSVGRAHNTNYWAEYLIALNQANPNIAVNIEHEDLEMGQVEGLTFAANTLHQAASSAGLDIYARP